MRKLSTCSGVVLFCFFSNLAAAQVYNLAHSARIVTSDPARIEGTRAGRLDEFPAADVFLTSEIHPDQRGVYAVPVTSGGGCIGLDWAERRVLSEIWLHSTADSADLSARDVTAQYWSSQGREDNWSDIAQTPWQGKWENLPGQLKVNGKELRLTIDPARVPEFKKGQGTLRIRWLLPASQSPIKVAELGATGPSSWTKGQLRIEREGPAASGAVTIQAYNGELIGPDGKTVATASRPPGQPCDLTVLYCSSPSKPDRTSLRITTARGMFAVAVSDVLANEGVYVKDFGAYITRAQGGLTFDEYRRKHASDRTILKRVREMPDQTFEQAMASLWDPVQNNGPTLLSLAADNRKFIVQRTGEILFKTDKEHLRVTPAFGNARTRLDRLDWGTVGLDTGVVPPGGKGQSLQIKDKKYAKGLGLHANSQFTVDLAGRYTEFQADVGVQWQGGGDCGQVSFQVLVDGDNKFDSGMMKQADAPRPVKISLAGAKQLVLVASTGSDIGCAVADWAEARLLHADGSGEYLSDLHAADRKISASVTRKLEGNWLPIPVNSVEDHGVRYTQRSYVVPMLQEQEQHVFSADRPLCVAEFTIENTTDVLRDTRLSLLFNPGDAGRLEINKNNRLVMVHQGEHVRAWLHGPDAASMKIDAASGISMRGTLSAGRSARFTLVIPGFETDTKNVDELAVTGEGSKVVEQYWKGMLGRAMQVETPESLLNDFIRSTQVRCLMAARNEADGKFIAPWIAADTYGPLDTEAQAVILGMDLFGHHEFARRCHEFFVNSYNADGMLAKGYTLMGTGQHLWTLAEHVRLTRDDEWLRRMAPQLLKPCDWINRQREKTRRATDRDNPAPESGLVPPGVLADWNRYAYYFYANAHYYAGMKAIADALARIQHPRAEELANAAADYRNDIMRAYGWNQERMPVVPLRDGTWVPPTPSSLYCYGQTRDFHEGVSATGHDVEVGGNHLIPLGLIDPASWQTGWIVDYMEDRWFLIDGIFGGYPASENEKDWFNRGGFAKLQPHYARTSDLHALRDDVKPFIRTYFNTFPVLLNRENLTYWEHLKNGGAWDKTHESGWFLEMTRTMLLMERGRELWLAPFVTNNWLKPGMHVSVKNAPTYFGTVSYELRGAQDRIEATVNPPEGEGLDQIILRVRNPEGKPMRLVTVDGKEHSAFDPKIETIALEPGTQPIHIVVQY